MATNSNPNLYNDRPPGTTSRFRPDLRPGIQPTKSVQPHERLLSGSQVRATHPRQLPRVFDRDARPGYAQGQNEVNRVPLAQGNDIPSGPPAMDHQNVVRTDRQLMRDFDANVKDAEALLFELDRRIRGGMEVVASIEQLQASGVDSTEAISASVAELKESFNHALESMKQSTQDLVELANWTRVQFDESRDSIREVLGMVNRRIDSVVLATFTKGQLLSEIASFDEDGAEKLSGANRDELVEMLSSLYLGGQEGS